MTDTRDVVRFICRLLLRPCPYVSDLPMRGGGFHVCTRYRGHDGSHLLGTPEVAEAHRREGWLT